MTNQEAKGIEFGIDKSTIKVPRSKQEEIREGIENKLTIGIAKGETPEYLSKWIVEFLGIKGVVIKRDRELPEPDIVTNAEPYPCNELCHKMEQLNMKQAGYVAVERFKWLK